MLKAIEAVALRKHFAVCWVTLDGRSHALNHPTSYLHTLLENLHVSNSPTRGLSLLVNDWLRGPNADSLAAWARQSNMGWPRPAIVQRERMLGTGEEPLYLGAWIESRDLMHKRGKLWFDTVSSRFQATAALLRAAGFSGVVYLFDELETVATLLTTIRQRFLSYAFLNLLIDGRKHPYCFFSFATTPVFGITITSDWRHREWYAESYADGHRFTEKWRESSIELMQLRALKRRDIIDLCKRLRDYHGDAFMWRAKERFADHFLERLVHETEGHGMGTREVVKALVHLLEIAEQHPTADINGALPTT